MDCHGRRKEKEGKEILPLEKKTGETADGDDRRKSASERKGRRKKNELDGYYHGMDREAPAWRIFTVAQEMGSCLCRRFARGLWQRFDWLARWPNGLRTLPMPEGVRSHVEMPAAQHRHYTAHAVHGLDKNIVSTTASERAVLSVLSLGVALRTDESGASEAAETCIFLAWIWLAFAGHVVLFWLWLPRRGRWTAPVDSEIQRKMCEMLGISALKGYQVEALEAVCVNKRDTLHGVCADWEQKLLRILK